MNKTDTVSSMLGTIKAGWQGSTLHEAFNTLLYTFPSAMAKAMTGDTRGIPTHIGFVYGLAGSSEPVWPATPRVCTWSDLQAALAEATPEARRNMQISAIGYTPTVSTLTRDGIADYVGNAITFTGVTVSDSSAELAFGGELYETHAGLYEGNKIYAAILLSKSGNVYTPLAKVSLVLDGTFPTKGVDDREFCVFWRIAFF